MNLISVNVKRFLDSGVKGLRWEREQENMCRKLTNHKRGERAKMVLKTLFNNNIVEAP